MTDGNRTSTGPQEARAGCCADWPKPCGYHEGYDSAWLARDDEIEELREAAADLHKMLFATRPTTEGPHEDCCLFCDYLRGKS